MISKRKTGQAREGAEALAGGSAPLRRRLKRALMVILALVVVLAVVVAAAWRT